MRSRSVGRAVRLADVAGALGAVFAALCCAGTPLIVGALAAVGLSFLRRDAILWPLMFTSLGVSLWGFWSGRRTHRATGPLVLATAGATALVAGVVVIHGFPAKQVIWAGAAALVVATLWNARERADYRRD
ncbi:MAG: MerC domain-containing protein [Gemmatimonadaceae bacterium]